LEHHKAHHPWVLTIIEISVVLFCTAPIYLSGDTLAQNPPSIQGVKMSPIKISVSIHDENLSEIETISQNLQSHGVNVEQTLLSIGIITGSIEPHLVDSLSKIQGVKQVEMQQSYQLAPPNSDIQ
jgi:phosphotransferase system IIB component